MCYHYEISTYCNSCGRQSSHHLEIFCVATTRHESNQRLNPADRCHIGKEPHKYPRKDATFPNMRYQYSMWSRQGCEICQEERQEFKKGDSSVAREQMRVTNNNQKHVDAREVEEMDGHLRKEDLGGHAVGIARAPHLGRNGRRALSKEEKRQRKVDIEKLFRDPKALEMQQRLLAEAIGRKQRGERDVSFSSRFCISWEGN